MTRRELREHCFKMLFSANFYDTEEAEQQLDRYFDAPEEDEMDPDGKTEVVHQVGLREEDKEYLHNRVEHIIESIPELDARLNQVAEGWKTRRMGKVELTILRLALYEMKLDDTIPEKVAINEAVELAKKYGGNDSPAFVNGILAKLV
ncbi:MAG TPA: transcription antitermination factor NusB [Candidatus Lachnoclostridium avicola]|nr:transcription antitermination factor NusB [Candidatus Lachnoclostridium avicola]